MSSLPPFNKAHYFFVGIAGAGMSALAQFQAMRFGHVSGSDRAFASGSDEPLRKHFDALNITCFPQDGSGITRDVEAVIRSTAVEDSNPDLVRARELGIPIFHRSQALSAWVSSFKTVAVAGTSGKSTVTAMIFEILSGAGRSPSVITGGPLVGLMSRGFAGNAWSGDSDILVIEADESDGTLPAYRPEIGLLLNVEKDHKEVPELLDLFRLFVAQSRRLVVNGDLPLLTEFKSRGAAFGHGQGCQFRLARVELTGRGSTFTINGVKFNLPMPGEHNVLNALAAAAACAALGVPLADMPKPLAAFQGVARRFQTMGVKRGVEVIDDYAHNPAKVQAAISAAHLRAKRVIAVFQPHGYGPARFMRHELVQAFAAALKNDDRLLMPEIYFAGGTVTRDISSADIVREAAQLGVTAEYAALRSELPSKIAAVARDGDVVLVMGARDTTLPALCREIVSAL